MEVFSAAVNDNIFNLTLKFWLFLHLHLHLFLSSLRWGWFRLTNIYRLHTITETTYDRSYLKVDLFCQVQMLLETSLSHCLDMVLWMVMNIVLWFTKISSRLFYSYSVNLSLYMWFKHYCWSVFGLGNLEHFSLNDLEA